MEFCINKYFKTEIPKIKNKIDWDSLINQSVVVVYNDVEYSFYITKHSKEDRTIFFEHRGKEVVMNKSNFIACKFGRILGFNDCSFKYSVNDKVNNFLILERDMRFDKTQNKKFYKIKCLKCGFNSKTDEVYKNGIKIDYWVLESNLSRYKCPCCSNPCKITVLGINDIPTTAPWMIKYFQGGYDEAKLYTKSSTKKFYPICPICKNIKSNLITINSLNTKKSIGCICGDGVSFPEKVVINILQQLNVKYKHQVNKSDFSWCKTYRYDFSFTINNELYILEVHGNQHYEGGFESLGGKNLNQQLEIDRKKKELAISNGINENNYIVLDCRYSDIDYIKQSLINSDLNKIISLDHINWEKCFEYAISSRVKDACSYYRNNKDISTKEVANAIGVNRVTAIEYLKIGSVIGLCDYNPHEEFKKNSERNGKLNGRRVEVFDKDNASVGIFESASYLERESERLFGVKISAKKIRTSCTKEGRRYEGFKFKYYN